MSDDDAELEAFVRAISAALVEDGLQSEVFGCGKIAAAVVSTMTDAFNISISNGLVLVHNARVDIRFLRAEERQRRVGEFHLADPHVFEQVSAYIKNYSPDPINNNDYLGHRTISNRLDEVHKWRK